MRTIILAAALLMTLAGCADDPEPANAEPEPPMNQVPAAQAPEVVEQPAELDPITIEGSISGFADCTLVGQGQAPVDGGSESIPVEALGRSYSIEIQPDATIPAPPTVCIFIDGASASASGTIPADASSFEFYADLAPNGVGYVITIV